jgi:hypothetical protein
MTLRWLLVYGAARPRLFGAARLLRRDVSGSGLRISRVPGHHASGVRFRLADTRLLLTSLHHLAPLRMRPHGPSGVPHRHRPPLPRL